MNRDLWTSWADKQAGRMTDRPWLLCKWETVEGVVWPDEKIGLMTDDIRDKLGLSKNHWLLDIGCGPGWIGRMLKHFAGQVVGVDFSRSMIKHTAAKKEIFFISADAQALPLASSSFQRILIYFTLMNITDEKTILNILREAVRALKPGGKILAGQMPLKSRRQDYDREKKRYLEYCRSRFQLGEDTSADHAPPIVLFDDDYDRELEEKLGVRVEVLQSWNHFWREGEPVQCSWRVDYLLHKEGA